MQDTNSNNPEQFFKAKTLLNSMIDSIRTPKWLEAEHGEIEQRLHKDGFELLRLLLQGHLDERARQEPQYDFLQQGGRQHT